MMRNRRSMLSRWNSRSTVHSPSRPREESEEPDFEREMQEAEEEDAYAGYEDVDIPEMQQILPSKTETAVKLPGNRKGSRSR